MSVSMKVRMAASAAVFLVAAGGCSSNDSAGAPAAQTKDDLVIGVMAPLTGGGADVGESATLGTKFAAQVINDAGGIDGRKVRLELADTKGEPTAGVSAVQRLITQKKVDAVVGPVYSQVTLATLPMLTQAKKLSVSFSGSGDLTPDKTPYSFSLLVDADAQVAELVNEVKRAKYPSVAFVSDNGVQAKSALESLKKALGSANVTLAGNAEYAYDTTDMTPQLLEMRKKSPAALVAFTSTGDHAGYILRARKELSWDVPVVGNYGFAQSGATIKIAGEDAFDKVTGVNYKDFTYCPTSPVAEPVKQFVTGLTAADPSGVTKADLNYVSLWYDSLFVIKAAIEANGGSTDGDTLARWIEKNAVNTKEGVNRDLKASTERHFLISADDLTTVRPAQLLELDGKKVRGVEERAHC